jgi:tRNA A-37 threonylcarbamoyl transferase component Bud32
MIKNKELKKIIDNFDTKGEIFAAGSRNTIKLFNIDGDTISVKSFKNPILINQIIYKYFRKSKAKRSYENAIKLMELDVKTPTPIAFFEFKSLIGLQKSYYVCKHIDNCITFYDVLRMHDYDKRTNLIKDFTRFTNQLHEKGIKFLDHSPGNTLLVESYNQIDFYLVDLNRMKFPKNLTFKQRIKNMSRIVTDKNDVSIIAKEYCKYYFEYSESDFFNELWKKTSSFQKTFYMKIRIKKIILFWR